MAFIYRSLARKNYLCLSLLSLVPEPGSYDLKSYFNPKIKTKNKYLNKKYPPNKGKIYTLPGTSEKKLYQFPIKVKKKFKIIKGILSEIKNS